MNTTQQGKPRRGTEVQKAPSRTKEATPLGLTLPDFTDRKAVTAFITVLRENVHRHGVRHLLRQCERIVRYQHLQATSLRRAHTALQVANGQRTALQLQKDHERGWRNTARRFYGGMSDSALLAYSRGIFDAKFNILNITKAELVEILVDNYVHMKRCEASTSVVQSTVTSL